MLDTFHFPLGKGIYKKYQKIPNSVWSTFHGFSYSYERNSFLVQPFSYHCCNDAWSLTYKWLLEDYAALAILMKVFEDTEHVLNVNLKTSFTKDA